jgi:hypothetical protein
MDTRMLQAFVFVYLVYKMLIRYPRLFNPLPALLSQ